MILFADTMACMACRRKNLVEEMADTMMFFADTLACMGVSAEEFSKAYREKHEKNMNRWKR